ncbi:MAG TPA: 50S ribosomal protein L32 [Phycisphaerae bacterium]|nr:50S ribosomal protein L32 [Phycisphaerae bacterium]
MLPKYKLARSRTRSRRSHHFMVPANYTYCPRCNTPRLPHACCHNCGYVRPGLSIKLPEES